MNNIETPKSNHYVIFNVFDNDGSGDVYYMGFESVEDAIAEIKKVYSSWGSSMLCFDDEWNAESIEEYINVSGAYNDDYFSYIRDENILQTWINEMKEEHEIIVKRK